MSEKLEKQIPQMPAEVKASIKQAEEDGLFRVMDIRSQGKVLPTSPKLAIAIPCGDKDDPDMYQCPHCKTRQFTKVQCTKCGGEFDQRLRLRRAGLVPIEMMANPLQLVMPLLTSVQFLFRKSILSAQARNEMTWQAIENGVKYIAYWDDDTLWPPKAFYDMHNIMERHPEAAVISGVYTTRDDCQEPLVYKQHGQGAYWDFNTNRGIIEPIFGAGAGCMLARVSALIEMREVLDEAPWWLDTHDLTRQGMWGHDIRFCKRMHELTAKKLGISLEEVYDDIYHNRVREGSWQVYLAGWIHCGHLDITTQKVYELPKDAPCFKSGDINTGLYWNHLWKQRGIEWGESATAYVGLYERICQMIPEGSSVVDVGCGIGVLMDMLTKKRHAHVFGVDISSEAIEMVKSRWMEGVVGDAADFHVKGEDHYVVATETIEHLSDAKLASFLKEASRGRGAILTTPDGHLEGVPAGEHVHTFDRTSLRNLLKPYFRQINIEKVAPHFLLAVCSNKRESAPKKKAKKGKKK